MYKYINNGPWQNILFQFDYSPIIVADHTRKHGV